ncbi:MAG: hypothetical protein KDD35_05600, partial [Bdellovibrionales bacterium]|nr:hypothetical protein [Bdellovibrionales bacterium]
EFGPRALGARSILANPRCREMKSIINDRIKYRESFRPFCPSLLESDIKDYFLGKSEASPFMNINFEVKQDWRSQLGAITHIDGTARVQTVNKDHNPLFYSLLHQLKKDSGCSVVLNTSFNLSHEPMVESPRQAIASFFGGGMDSCLIGDFLVTK